MQNREFFIIGAFFAGIVFGPVWLVVFLGLVVLFFTSGIAVIFGALLFDLLYTSSMGLYGLSFVATSVAVLIVFLITIIKKRLR